MAKTSFYHFRDVFNLIQLHFTGIVASDLHVSRFALIKHLCQSAGVTGELDCSRNLKAPSTHVWLSFLLCQLVMVLHRCNWGYFSENPVPNSWPHRKYIVNLVHLSGSGSGCCKDFYLQCAAIISRKLEMGVLAGLHLSCCYSALLFSPEHTYYRWPFSWRQLYPEPRGQKRIPWSPGCPPAIP